MCNIKLEEIPLAAIVPDPDQPRNFPLSLAELIRQAESGDRRAKEDLDKLTDLATSILEVGLEQPITVYPSEESNEYIIYDGHRRWMAMTLLQEREQTKEEGYGKIQCYVRPVPKSDEDTLLGQLNTSTQREELNIFELARSLKHVHDNLQRSGGTARLVREDGSIETIEVRPGTSDQVIWNVVERKVGISRSRRYQIQAVLKLPPRIQDIAEKAGLPESRLRYIVPLEDEQIQDTIIHEIVEKNLSNAEIRRRIKELQEQAVELPPQAMPKPMQIRSAIKPVRRLTEELKRVRNIPEAINKKDPRTVKSYKELLPELHTTLKDLETVINELEFLEAE
jgi:ParB/RepB/Spo0J family partition protein